MPKHRHTSKVGRSPNGEWIVEFPGSNQVFALPKELDVTQANQLRVVVEHAFLKGQDVAQTRFLDNLKKHFLRESDFDD